MRLLVLACLLAGCTTIDTQVNGWPQDMTITIHPDSGFIAVQKRCWPDMPWYWKLAGGVALQCTTINLESKTCDIYTLAGDPSPHELAHCTGGDHDGTLQRHFDRWKSLRTPHGH